MPSASSASSDSFTSSFLICMHIVIIIIIQEEQLLKPAHDFHFKLSFAHESLEDFKQMQILIQ